jgi:mono/diheme cytochrome c family protein
MRRLAFVLVLAPLAAAWSAAGDEPVLPRGGQAYLAHCAVCHGAHGAGDGPLAASIRAEGKAPPPPLGRERMIALGRGGIRDAIASGAHRGGATMPLWERFIGPEWIDRIADFLITGTPADTTRDAAVERDQAAPGGTPPDGRRTYVLYCSGCHGPEGRGDGYLSESRMRRLAVGPLGAQEIGRLDARRLEILIGPGGAHAPEAETMPGWLHTLSPVERRALLGYLRSLAPPR